MDTSLNEYELNLVSDPHVLLTKNNIIQKVFNLFGGLSEKYKEVLRANSLLIENKVDAKISRGENYKGLPYLVLDYPRQFGKVDIFAIRTFFWWGNFFSITLQLGGRYQDKYLPAIQKNISANLFEGWFLGIGDNAWEHHFEIGNYALINPTKDYKISGIPFIKVAKKIPLDKWDDAEFFFKKNFIFLIEVLNS